jgi:hypothetical protein
MRPDVSPSTGTHIVHVYAWHPPTFLNVVHERRRTIARARTSVTDAMVRAVPAFELAILRAIFHSKGPKA